MKCRVDGCDREIMYKEKQLCQKHYFRLMRNGTTDLKKPAGKKSISPNGYVTIYAKGHPLAILAGRNRIYEHRVVYYDSVDSNPTSCALCDTPVSWSTLHIDHINKNTKENTPDNLRCLCRGCNTILGYTDKSYGTEIEINGVSMTPHAWSRQPDVKVSGATIRNRISRGKSPREAVYGDKKTHKDCEPSKSAIKTDAIRQKEAAN